MGQKIQAGEAFVQITADDSGFRQSLQRASNALSDLGDKMFATGKTIAAAGAAMLAPFVAAMKKFVDMGVGLDRLSQKTGISAKSLSELQYALNETGGSTDALKGGLTSMAQFLDQAAQHSHVAHKELSRLGLNFGELQAMNPEERFEAVARAIGAIADPSKQASAAMAVFGSQGDDLLPLIKNLDKLRAEAVASGMLPSKEALEDAAAIGKATRLVGTAMTTLQTELASAFVAVTKNSLAATKGVIQGVTNWIKNNQALVSQIASVARVVAIAGAVISAIGGAFFAASAACSVLAGSITAVGAVLSALVSPFAIVTAAVVGGIAAWALYTESGKATVQAITKFFGDLFSVAKDTIGGITAALTAGDLELAGKIAVTGLKLIFVQGMAAIANAVGGTWGDTIASLTADIAQGDLEGAWNTMVLALSSVWDSFCSGIFKAFASAAKAIIGVWASTTKSVAKWIADQDLRANRGKGALTGIDLEAEKKRSDDLNAKRVKMLKRELGEARAELAGYEAGGGDSMGAGNSLQRDDLRAHIADLEESLKAASNARSFEDQLADGIDQQIDGQAGSLTSAVDSITTPEIERRERRAAESRKGLHDHVDGGASALDAELAALRAQLAGQKKEAEGKAAKAAAEADDAHDKRKGAAEGTADSIAGTFSAAALSQMGGPNRTAEMTLDELKAMRKDNLEQQRKLVNLQKTLERMGAIR